MSKDFEQAYKELAQSEIPDLWDRIEAGLSEKSTPDKKEGMPSERKKKIYFRRYTGVAAAALCVALIVPAALFLRQQGQKSGHLEMAADQGIMEESAEVTECAPETAEGVEEAEGAQADEEPRVAMTGGEESMTSSSADADADFGGDIAADMTAVEESVSDIMEDEEKKMENGVSSAAAESLSAPKLRETAELTDGTVMEKVTIEVIDGTTQMDEKTMGTVYTAVVLKDESGSFGEGEHIEVFVPAHSSAALIAGRTFETDLIYREGEEYPFILNAIR